MSLYFIHLIYTFMEIIKTFEAYIYDVTYTDEAFYLSIENNDIHAFKMIIKKRGLKYISKNNYGITVRNFIEKHRNFIY